MSNRFPRAVALAALVVGLSTSPISAQNGSNFNVHSNQFDAVYTGFGAGGTQTAADGFGMWIPGEENRGNSLTTLGDFGYRQVGWRESPCVLGPAIPGLAIRFPAIAFVEMDGVNPFDQTANVFTHPVCGVPLGCFPLGNSAGVAPYGPATSSTSFFLAGYPSGLGLPSTAALLLPNNGLIPSSAGGTATLYGFGSASLAIGSTGFCWGVQFGWGGSANPNLDDINGTWIWRQNSPDGNQYWPMSTDENNIWQSNTIFTDAGLTALVTFFAPLNYEYYSLSADPTTNPATAPVGSNGAGTYYATGVGIPQSGNSVNGGFDMGVHGGLAHTGVGGTLNPITGLGGQDPAGSPTAGLIPTLGLVSWNNAPSTLLGSARFHLGWFQIAFDLSFALDPAGATDITFFFGQSRTPVTWQLGFPTPFPQPITNAFFPFLTHSPNDQSLLGNLWADPMGFPGGTFGVAPWVGSSIHLPTATASVAIGVPVGVQIGSSQLLTATGPLTWGGPQTPGETVPNQPSNSTLIPLVD